MSLTKNQYLADASLNLLIGVAIATPISIRIALTTIIPTRSDTNATLTRTTYPGYMDTTITSDQWASIVESAVTGSSVSTLSDINFPNASATPSPPSTILGFAILDNFDNILYQSPLFFPLVVSSSGQMVQIPAGSLTLIEA